MKSRILLLIILISVGYNATGQYYFFRQYSNNEGLLNPFVYDINQDNQGYMLIGTPDGLYRFNGFDFEHFTTEDGIADNFVTKIFKDSKGRIWIGHQNGSISLRIKEGFRLFNVQSDIQGSVTDLTEDETGSIWISVQNQGVLLINNNLNISVIDFSNKDELLTQIEFVGADRFLIGTQENLYLTNYNQVESSLNVLQRFDQYPGSKVVKIIPVANDGYIVVSQEDGLYQLSPEGISGAYLFSAIDENPKGMLDNLQGGLTDRNGDLWVNSMGNGLTQFRPNQENGYQLIASISADRGLISENAKSMFEDLEGNLWIGMYGEGLLKYVDSNLKFYRYDSDGYSLENYAIAGFDDNLMAATGDRLLEINRLGDTVVKAYPLPEHQMGDRVNTIYTSGDGSIWIGCEQSGVYVARAGNLNFNPVFISRDELANSVNHITGQGEDIWISTKKGLCLIKRNSGLKKWFTTNEGLPHNNIKQMYIDPEGRVLIATQCKEIHYINKNDEVAVLENSGMGPFNSIVSFGMDAQETLWAGSMGNGVWWITDDTIKNFTRESGLLSDFCYSLALTKEGKPVVSHSGGISLIDPETNIVKTFSGHDGVKSSAEFYTNAVYTDRIGNIWFGTSEGLIQYTSTESKGEIISPMLQISAVMIDGDTIDHTQGPVLLKAGQYELVVDYIGISFTNPESVFYTTKLEGYNKSWSDPTFNRRITYDMISHGEYEFKIRAFTENDIRSEEDSAFRIKIKKPVYLSVWFYGMIAVILGIMFFSILRIRERNHKMVQERLLKNLDEKSKEIIVKEEIIKERRKVEKILIEAKTKAELSEQLKTSFLQNMSHEIRTPMNAIVGFSSLLKEEELTDETRNEFVDNVSTNAESLLGLIDDILDISKLETNALNIKKGMCNLNELILRLESTYQKRLKNIEKEGIELKAIVPSGDDIEITTDVIRLKQVLSKLLDNAVKFTEAGRITLGFKEVKEGIEFFVEDTGIGLSEDKKEVIFDLFRKIEDDKLKLYGGTGLGLTLSRYLVTLLGGEIQVDSKEGIGSRFYFVLPFEKADDGKLIEKSGTDNEFKDIMTGKRILVVEDDEINFKLIYQYLLATGAAVDWAKNSEETLQMYFKEGAFDLILMDIKLPGMNGYEISMRIREIDKTVPIIAQTAFAMEGDEELSLEAGCNAYIAKPIKKNILLKMITDLIFKPKDTSID